MKSRTRLIAGAALVVASVLATTAGISMASGHDETVLKAEVLVGVTPPYTGATNPIRGINGGGIAWKIGPSEVRLRASGKVEAEINGLVLVATGTNPPQVTQFKVIVSCLSSNASGPTTVNVATDPVAVGADGNAEIEGMVELPTPCIAPIIFITNGSGAAWFAATGV